MRLFPLNLFKYQNTPQGSVIEVDTLCQHNLENNMLWSIEHNASIVVLFSGLKVPFYDIAYRIFFLELLLSVY